MEEIPSIKKSLDKLFEKPNSPKFHERVETVMGGPVVFIEFRCQKCGHKWRVGL